MKCWAETREVLDRCSQARAAGLRAALCTVIQVSGSTYRRAGAKLLVVEDETSAGNISGGCVEEDVREVAARVIRSGQAELRTYCSGLDELPWELGLGCEGRIDVLVAPAPEAPSRQRVLLDGRSPFAVATMLPSSSRGHSFDAECRLIVSAERIEGTLGLPDLDAVVAVSARQHLGMDHSSVQRFADRSVFIEHFVPPPRLVLFGAGEDARPVARLATDVGFSVAVVDKRPAYLTAERFPKRTELLDPGRDDFPRALTLDESCYVVIMTHNLHDDLAFVRMVLETAVPYIGILGPRRRTERILSQLAATGYWEESHQGRIYGPVGLDIRAEGAEQIALSIVSEALAVRARRDPASLRERATSIHEYASS